MGIRITMNLPQLIVFLFILDSCQAYKSYKLNDLCPTNLLKIGFDFLTANHPQVELELSHRSGAYVPLVWNATSLKKYEVCEFKVDANKFGYNRGVFATLQKMSLRKSITGECIDFIKFKHDNGATSERLCGNYKATDEYSRDHSKFFADETGRMRVHIELDVKRPLEDPNETLEVELFLTAFTKDCAKPGLPEISCSPGRCISKEFENDGIINCSPQQCSDEEKCVKQVPVQAENMISGKNIAISAITSLLLTMIAFFCVYACCKYKYCPTNTSSNTSYESGNNRRAQRGGDNSPEFHNVELPSSSVVYSDEAARPTAPPLDEKDLPPTYESLFIKNHTTVPN